MVCSATVYHRGQQVEAGGGGDDIGMFLAAVGASGDVPDIGLGGGVGAVTGGALGNGDGLSGLGEAGARPADEGVALARGVDEGEGGGPGGVGDWVGGGYVAVGEVVCDTIDCGDLVGGIA